MAKKQNLLQKTNAKLKQRKRDFNSLTKKKPKPKPKDTSISNTKVKQTGLTMQQLAAKLRERRAILDAK